MLALLIALTTTPADPQYVDAAKQAATWLRTELKKPGQTTDLYAGTSGVALFFTEAYYSTGDKQYLADAKGIGDALMSSAAAVKDSGFYTGLAGIAFTLNEIAKASHDTKYSQAATSCLQRIQQQAKSVGKGVEWPEGNDIVSGSAGIGCFLLYAAKDMKRASALDLARKTGDRLIEVAMPEDGGLKWKMAADYDRLMPNFSHGTAGVSFFLARLYEETRDKRYLDAAQAGASYLIKQTNKDGLIFHNDQNGKDLYYLGWCHGPVGTSRLFGVLHRSTGDMKYGDWIDHASAALLKSGIPEKQTAGFWNNVGQCCGSAGVAEFMLDIYQFDQLPEEIGFAKRLTADLLHRATKERDGLKWTQAEHRVQPENLQAQIGYMQGAAGIGMWLLHLDYQERGVRQKIYFPDNPFHGRH